MKNNKAFTLIEMLVVIAMIGLLSAVLLVALGPSRNKAKDARVISDVKQIVALGQTFYDPIRAKYDINALSASAAYGGAYGDIIQQGGKNFAIKVNASSTSFAISVTLPSGGAFCADSNGNVSSSTALENGLCP